MSPGGTPLLLLASGSPRRRDLLASVGIPLRVQVPRVDESPRPGESPGETVRRLAEAKARAVHERHPRPRGLVLAADTDVVLDGRTLGKPADAADARRMLRALSGREHRVLTGTCLLDQASGDAESFLAETRVWFRELSTGEVDGYVATGEPLDKAGAYACQGVGAFCIARIEGSYTNVVGLPLGQVLDALARLGGPRAFEHGSDAP